MTGTPLKILGLSGSYGMSSSNGKLLKLALDYAQNQGIEIHNWDHEKHPLPLSGVTVFSDGRNFGAAASARAGASRPLHQKLRPSETKHFFDPRGRENHVK